MVCRLILSRSARILEAAPEVDVGGGEIIDALVIAPVIVVGDEGRDLGLQIAGQEVIFQQDAVLEGLVPTLDLALGHRMIGRATQALDVAGAEPLGEVTRDIAGTVVGQEAGGRSAGSAWSSPLACGAESSGAVTVLGLHLGAQLPGDDVAGNVVAPE